MEIPRKAWQNYISKLSKINKKAAQIMTDWINANGYDSIENMIAVANGLTQKYGEASAALACEMYDSIAAASGVAVPPAIPAEVMPEEYVAQAVRKTVDQAPTTVPNVVGRMVKQAGADTMLQNARRDGAQFAWIPSGDTCAFCITLASRGWQYMSRNALKNGHAEHIHSNCDCEYAIRFSEKDDVAGYDPQKYEEMYRNADGNTPQEKINAMRRSFAEKQSKSVEKIAINTREEAYAMLTEHIGFGSVSDSVSVIEEKLLFENVEQLKRLNDKFGALTTENYGYFTATSTPKAVAYTQGSFKNLNNQSLSLCGSSYGHGYDFLVEKEKNYVATNWSMPCLDKNFSIYTVTHEYGHILENKIINGMVDMDEFERTFNEKLHSKNGAKKSFDFAKKVETQHGKTIWQEIVQIAKNKNNDFRVSDHISDYGKTNYFEAFAETFANSQLGKPNELGDAMNEWLRRKGY